MIFLVFENNRIDLVIFKEKFDFLLLFLLIFVIIVIENNTLRRESLMKTAILTSTLLSISFLTMNLSAGTSMTCKDGVCILDISNLSSDDKKNKEVKNKKKLFSVVKDRKSRKVEMITLNKSKYIQQKNEKLEPMDNNKMETIILSPEKYVMTVAEVEKYELEHIQLRLPNKNIANKIIEKTTLPTSAYFCENNKKAVYDKETNSYECG